MDAGEILKFGLIIAVVYMIWRWMAAGGLRASASVSPYNGAPLYDYGVSPWLNTSNGYGYNGGFGAVGPTIAVGGAGWGISIPSGVFNQMQPYPGGAPR